MVRAKGLEPSRPKALAPKASVSTNSTTRAYFLYTLAYLRMLRSPPCAHVKPIITNFTLNSTLFLV